MRGDGAGDNFPLVLMPAWKEAAARHEGGAEEGLR